MTVDQLNEKDDVRLGAAERSPVETIMDAYLPSCALHGAAKLGVADVLVDGPRAIEELADVSRMHPRSLGRLFPEPAPSGLPARSYRSTTEPIQHCPLGTGVAMASVETSEVSESARVRRLSTFSDCSDEELAKVMARSAVLRRDAGAVLVAEGDPGTDVFVVLEGKALVTRHGEPLASLGPGDLFAEMAGLDNGVRTATVTASTPVELLLIDPRRLAEVIGTGTVAWKMLRTLNERLGLAHQLPGRTRSPRSPSRIRSARRSPNGTGWWSRPRSGRRWPTGCLTASTSAPARA